MERMISVEKINEDGVLIAKSIPISLLSMYLNMGWTKKTKKSTFQPKKEFKIDKKEDLD